MNLLNRLLAVLLALALLLGGLLAAAEIVLAQLRRPRWLVPHEQWSSWLGTQTWDTSTVRTWLIVIGVIGLLLLLIALRRGRPAGLAVRTDSAPPGVRTTATRRGIEKTLESAVGDVDGVSSVKTSVGRRRVDVKATTNTRGGQEKQVQQAVTDRLAALGLQRTLRPRVTTTPE